MRKVRCRAHLRVGSMQRRDPTADFCLRLPAGLYTLSPGCGLLLRTSRRGSRSCASRPSPTHSSMLLESWSVYLSNPCLMRPCPMCSRSSSITFAPLPGKGGLTVATCVAQSHSQVFHLLCHLLGWRLRCLRRSSSCGYPRRSISSRVTRAGIHGCA